MMELTRAVPDVTPTPRAPARLPFLDGMRGIAAMVVVYYHARHFGLIQPLVPRGYLFVDFFFLLSGFVLGISVDAKLRGGLGPLRFFTKRFCRLWPVMAVGTLIGVLQFAVAGQLMAAMILLPGALMMVPMLSLSGLVFPLNSPVWSLTMELIANAIHALLLARLGKRALIVFIAANGALLFAAICNHGYNEFGAVGDRWLPGIPRVCFSYALGLFLAREWLAGGRLAGVVCPWWVAVAVPFVSIVGLPYVPLPGWAGDSLVTLLVLPVSFACSLNVRLPRLLAPLFSGLGLLSYPLYAVHLPFLVLASILFTPLVGSFVGPTCALLTAAVLAHLLETRNVGRKATVGLVERAAHA